MEKRGQVTIFVIIAIIIIAAVIVFFSIRGRINLGGIPARFEAVEQQFLGCIEDYSISGVSLLEEHGGYIYLPEFEPGSDYAPVSNQLDFLGTSVPYWYYISGNNIIKEQVPSKNDMEKQLETYLEENLECDFSNFQEQGFFIDVGEINADVKILDYNVDINIKADLEASFEEQSVRISNHNQDIDTSLGKFYNTAIKIYNTEKQESFLESYGLDVLYLYAPVNDVELTCSPKTWVVEDIKQEVKNALEANTIMLKTKSDYYETDKQGEYFIVDV
ncbi:MAG: hypothetical protein ABIH72_02465, partial [archaeon]